MSGQNMEIFCSFRPGTISNHSASNSFPRRHLLGHKQHHSQFTFFQAAEQLAELISLSGTFTSKRWSQLMHGIISLPFRATSVRLATWMFCLVLQRAHSTVITRSRFSGIIESLCHIIPRTACWLTGVVSFSPSLIFGRCGRATDAKKALRNTGMSVYLSPG